MRRMPAARYSAIVSTGSRRAAVAAGARSARRGISARARSNSARSSSGKVLSSPERELVLQYVIRQLRGARRRVSLKPSVACVGGASGARDFAVSHCDGHDADRHETDEEVERRASADRPLTRAATELMLNL